MLARVTILLSGVILLFPAAGFAVIHDISITGFDFVPGNQTIDQGDTVRWTNNDAFLHTSTSDALVWNSGNLANGQSFSFAFVNAGVFPYHCAVHITMKDTITVVGAPTIDLQIDMGDNFFSPPVVQINIGETIRWLNSGLVDHTTTAGDGLWDSGTLMPGQFFDFTFAAEGVHDYV